jgi:hypothetical protein
MEGKVMGIESSGNVNITTYGIPIDSYHDLLDKYKKTLEQTQDIASIEKIENLQELVDQLSDEKVKRRLTEELGTLQEGVAKYKQEMRLLSEAEAEIKLEQQRIDGLERKSKIWLSFLQRESAASIIGGIVLLMLTVALISGMIFGRESQILSNGFLVILGYFFGQSSSKNKDSI